jgi:hypothetical protein
MYEGGQYLGPVPRCKEEAMLQQSKDMDREVASAIAEEGLQAREDSVPGHLYRARRSQLRDGRHVAVDRGIVASNGQLPS